MPQKLKRKFIIGDEWLYYQIYTGPKLVDYLLANEFYKLTLKLLKLKIIDKFFFIRYSDPEFHLRIRFHLTDNENIQALIKMVNDKLRCYIDKNFIWDIKIGTYNRELERYNPIIIDEIEYIFHLDSIMVLQILNKMQKMNNSINKNILCMIFMDKITDSFGLTIDEKVMFYNKISSAFFIEFNIKKDSRINMDKRFRNIMPKLLQATSQKEEIPFPGYYSFFEMFKEILVIIKKKEENVEPNFRLLGSLIHMHINRFFDVNQRKFEMEFYYHLYKYYKSRRAFLSQNNSI